MTEPPMTQAELQQRLAEQDKKIAELQHKFNVLVTDALLPVLSSLDRLLLSALESK